MSTVDAWAEHRFAALAPEAVFDAWTKPVALKAWMTLHLREREPDAEVTRVDVDAVPGGRYHFADSRDGSDAWGYYKVLQRPQKLAFSWFVSPEEEAEDNSLVTIEIVQDGAGSIARISHKMPLAA